MALQNLIFRHRHTCLRLPKQQAIWRIIFLLVFLVSCVKENPDANPPASIGNSVLVLDATNNTPLPGVQVSPITCTTLFGLPICTPDESRAVYTTTDGTINTRGNPGNSVFAKEGYWTHAPSPDNSALTTIAHHFDSGWVGPRLITRMYRMAWVEIHLRSVPWRAAGERVVVYAALAGNSWSYNRSFEYVTPFDNVFTMPVFGDQKVIFKTQNTVGSLVITDSTFVPANTTKNLEIEY
jgi:hypothetical protein